MFTSGNGLAATVQEVQQQQQQLIHMMIYLNSALALLSPLTPVALSPFAPPSSPALRTGPASNTRETSTPFFSTHNNTCVNALRLTRRSTAGCATGGREWTTAAAAVLLCVARTVHTRRNLHFIGDFCGRHGARHVSAAHCYIIVKIHSREMNACTSTGGGGVLLLVGQHQHLRIAQLVVAQHVLQRVACKRLFHSVTIKANSDKEADTFKAKRARSHHALAIERVHDVDDALAASVVVAPQCSNLVLAAHIPHSEAYVLVPAQTRGS
jgi:hypothetical protein